MSFRSPPPGNPIASSIPGVIPDRRRFQPTDEQWAAIAAAAGLDMPPAWFKRSLSAACDTYIQACTASRNAVPTKNLLARAERMKAALDDLRREFRGPILDPAATMERHEFGAFMVAVIKDNQLPSIREFGDGLTQLDHLLSVVVARIQGEMKAERRAATEGEGRHLLIDYLADVYKTASGKRASIRKDVHDLGRVSPFVKFLATVWIALPGGAPPLTTLNTWALKARAWALKIRKDSGANGRRKKRQRFPSQ